MNITYDFLKTSFTSVCNIMERNLQLPLATESFSYSWLIHKPPPPSSDDNLGKIEHSSVENEDNFHFDIQKPPTNLVSADEIFSDGQIMPVYASSSRLIEPFKTSTSVAAAAPTVEKRRYFVGKWRRSSERILRKWLGFVKTLSWSSSRKSSKVDDLDRKFFELRSLSDDASPRRSSAHSAVEWGDLEISSFDTRRDRCLKIDKSWRSSSCSSPDVITTPFRYGCDDADENSIHEAILYCKRSIEK